MKQRLTIIFILAFALLSICSKTQAVDVKTTKIAKSYNYNQPYSNQNQPTGSIKLKAVLTKGGKVIPSNIYWKVYPYSDNGVNENARSLKYSSRPQPTFKLPAGRYIVEARYKRIKKYKAITIENNKNIKDTMDMNAGLIKVKATLGENGEPLNSNLRWEINNAEADFFENQNRVESSYKPTEIFLLPQGKYQLKVTFVRLAHTQNFEIKAGEKKVITMPIKAGFLQLKAVASENGEPITEGVTFNITSNTPDFAGNYKNVAYGNATRASFVLKPGNYIVKTRYGRVSNNTPIEIKLGEKSQKVINLNAGSIRLSANMPHSKEPLDKVRWRIEQKRGSVKKRPIVTTSYKATPTFVLPAGQYTVTASYGNIRTTKDITVDADKFKDVVVTLDK